MKIQFQWEPIDSQTLRAKVPGGWVLRFQGHSGATAMTLVPDPKHQWEVVIPGEVIAETMAQLEKLEQALKNPYMGDTIKSEMVAEAENLRRFIDHHT